MQHVLEVVEWAEVLPLAWADRSSDDSSRKPRTRRPSSRWSSSLCANACPRGPAPSTSTKRRFLPCRRRRSMASRSRTRLAIGRGRLRREQDQQERSADIRQPEDEQDAERDEARRRSSPAARRTLPGGSTIAPAADTARSSRGRRPRSSRRPRAALLGPARSGATRSPSPRRTATPTGRRGGRLRATRPRPSGARGSRQRVDGSWRAKPTAGGACRQWYRRLRRHPSLVGVGRTIRRVDSR